MNLNLIDLIAWIIAVLLLYEGVTSWREKPRRRIARIFLAVSMVIFSIATGFWYLSAQASGELANKLQTSAIKIDRVVQMDELKKLKNERGEELSIKLARSIFVSAGEIIDVIKSDGSLTPYLPDLEDIRARDRQLKMISEVDSQRQNLLVVVQVSENQWMRWFASFIVVLFGTMCIMLLKDRFSKN